ncbi:hypothetical protein SLE2022_137260 [Rubroshorea leprosula]
MEWVWPSIEIVKLVGGRFVRCLKYQIKYNDLLQKFEQSKQGLRSRRDDIQSKRETQLQSAPYNVVRAEVEDWLKEVEEFIERQDVVDEVNSRGYLSWCCRAVILEERTQELKEIYDRADNYTRDCLVIEDHSKKFNYYVQNFNEWKEKLQCKQVDIGSKLNLQLVFGKIEMEEAKRWRGKVEEMLKGVKDIEDKIGGRLSHSSDSLIMLLGEKIREMETMCEEGSQLPDYVVIDDPSALAVELPVSKLQGSQAVKANILACLKGEEVTMLGVWGMGGVGKTTVMMHVHNELLKEGIFKKVIWVTVSQNFNIYNLQEQIASSLEENLQEHQNTINRAAKLSKMLEKHKPYLLILDDVWSSFKLEDVGLLEPNVSNGCKLVLTTRSQEVARSMDCRRIQVETLLEEEALKLFLNKVGGIVLSDHGGGIKRDLESTLKEIVDECDGLPLALITVAGSLKGISESQLWSVALNELRDCKRNVAGTDANAFQILKFSYDHLIKKQIQYCFLYCALYPEDCKIPKEEIIESWIDEGFIDEMESRQSMKDEGYGILRKLEDNSLLELIKDEVRGDRVRMHDLIRDMALDITRMSPRFLVEAGKALKELPEKVKCAEGVEKVSLMHNYIEEIPWRMVSPTCTSLTTLLLAYNELSTIPESVFEHMPELKILDLSFNYKLWSLPNSVSKLVKLTTLLLESTSLKKVPSLSGLGSLKKLNLRETKIKEVPEGLGMLKNLKCLFLCGSEPFDIIEIDEIADEVLSNLSKLQELIVDGSRIKLKGDVVGRLMKLEVFHGWFPTANDMRIFLRCQPDRLSSYFITVGSNLFMTDSFLEILPRYKKIMVFTETCIVGENMLFPSIQILGIEACRDIRSLDDFSKINDATDLRICWIRDCDGMECIFPSWINNSVVQTVEYLKLVNLHKLDGLLEANIIAKSSPPPGTFSSLKVVRIFSCKKLKKLFPSWKLVEYLQSLESIDVNNCEEMEEIIASDLEEGEEGGDIIKELILSKLKHLRLERLPALKSICGRKAVMECDSLERIEITDCRGLRRIPFRLLPHLFLSELDYLDWVFEVELISMSPPQPCTFSSLKEIKIQECKRAKKLFPSWKLVEYLPSLEGIEVGCCEEMEEVIGSDPEEREEGGDTIKKLIHPKLKYLSLKFLPALKSICSRRAVMVCDSLKDIEIDNCRGLRRIPFHLPPYLSLCGLNNLDWLFEVELIAMSPPQPCTFSSLKEIKIQECKRAKLFPSWKLVEYLQSLESIYVRDCEMEEIIGSDPEEEGEERGGGGDFIKKLFLPKLKRLIMLFLPALKSMCSRRARMVCDSLESITIYDCKGLRRIPLSLPLVDNAQPSPPPSLKKINIYGREQEWWESLEWDHPNAKDVLQPMVQVARDGYPILSSESELSESVDYPQD